MDKTRLTEIFNLGFRCGANDRASAGFPLSRETQPPASAPSSPAEYSKRSEQIAWSEGYRMGYKIGASDAELASVDVPGAHGMVSGMGEEMLELFGAFKNIPDD